jgi:hypothetical protein
MRLVIEMPDSYGNELKKHAAGHPVYAGNVSALIRSIIANFFASGVTSKCRLEAGEPAPQTQN